MTSIRRRLLVGIGLGVSLAFLASGVLVAVLARSSLERQFDDHLLEQAVAMSALVEQDGAQIESDLGSQFPAGRGTEYYELWDAQGAVVNRSSSLTQRELVPFATPDRVLVRAVTLPDGRAGRQITMRFTPRQEAENGAPSPAQTVVLALARSTGDVDDTLARIGTVLAGVGIAGTLVCILVLIWVVRFGLAPLRSLAVEIAGIAENDLRARIDAARSPAELRLVVQRLNELLARLAAAFARERELTAEVAHELRTPLAGLRTTLEVALDRDRPIEKYRTTLADCLAITVQTQRTVTSMLSLARLDAGNFAFEKSSVAIDDLVREVLASLAPQADERGLQVTTNIAPQMVSTDREQLRTVIHNVIENAVTYADADGTVDVSLAAGHLRVVNTCTTLAPSDADKVFDRFWRGDSSRTGGTHAGLGLALSKKLVERLGGKLTAEISNGRFTALLLLPP